MNDQTPETWTPEVNEFWRNLMYKEAFEKITGRQLCLIKTTIKLQQDNAKLKERIEHLERVIDKNYKGYKFRK